LYPSTVAETAIAAIAPDSTIASTRRRATGTPWASHARSLCPIHTTSRPVRARRSQTNTPASVASAITIARLPALPDSDGKNRSRRGIRVERAMSAVRVVPGSASIEVITSATSASAIRLSMMVVITS